MKNKETQKSEDEIEVQELQKLQKSQVKGNRRNHTDSFGSNHHSVNNFGNNKCKLSNK